MSAYAKVLENLQLAILNADQSFAIENIKDNPTGLRDRFNVYILGYRTRLVQAILSDYPLLINYLSYNVVERYAYEYVESSPSTSYTLDTYPFKFSEYISQCINDGFANALAKFESAIAEVFWLENSHPFVPTKLTGNQLMGLRFLKRKAAKIIYLEYSIEEYTIAIRKGEKAEAPKYLAHYVFIVRHKNEIKRHILEKTEKLVLSYLFSGMSVGEILEEISSNKPELTTEIENKLQYWFSRWVENGFLTMQKN